MSTAAHAPALRSVPRDTFGVVLSVAWGIETSFWVVRHDPLRRWTARSCRWSPLSPRSPCWSLLAGMEGLEVAVIDRWRSP